MFASYLSRFEKIMFRDLRNEVNKFSLVLPK